MPISRSIFQYRIAGLDYWYKLDQQSSIFDIHNMIAFMSFQNRKLRKHFPNEINYTSPMPNFKNKLNRIVQNSERRNYEEE